MRLTLLSSLDRFNRVLACLDTFLAQIVMEALELARFARSLVAALPPSMGNCACKGSRGRDAGYPAPPAQIRTCGTTAYGSCLECVASKRTSGNGWQMRMCGRQASLIRLNLSQVRQRPF